MIEDPRGNGRRDGEPALARFLASPAPDAMKAAVQVILPRLARYTTLNEAVIGSDDPVLLEQILALTPAGLDFFHLLRDEKPTHPRHSRQHVSAALRAKCRVPRGPITPADFPAGHHVPLLADIFWGGVAAWAAAAPGRSQKPKGYWQVRGNQIAALRSFAEHHPDSSITLATLNDAGLHALARGLDAEMLEKLAREAGLSRQLRQKAAGFWTVDTVIAAYVALCEKAGLPLTNHMLTKVGGQGFTIRSNAQKLCGTFRAFRTRVGELHPWLGPKAQPRTSDGLLLDSFQEVAVYERLRRALPPEVSIVPHVLLDPTLPHRSADFLVSGTVYVETLMISLADMASPRSRPQQHYAGKWRCKAAWYAAQNKSLVIIEPDDILAADRLIGKVDQVRRLVGLPAPANEGDRARGSGPQVSTVRPKGYWTFDTLCKVVAAVARTVGGFPTHADLVAAGYHSAPTMLTRVGRRRVAARICWPLRHQKGVWTPERVEQEVAAWTEQHGCFPSIAELKATGHSRLAGAAQRLFNGRTAELRRAVERILGRTLSQRKMPNGSYANQERLAALLRPVCASLGRFPTRSEVRAAGLSPTIWAMVSTRYGVRAMASFMAVPYSGARRRRTRSGATASSPRDDLFDGRDPAPER